MLWVMLTSAENFRNTFSIVLGESEEALPCSSRGTLPLIYHNSPFEHREQMYPERPHAWIWCLKLFLFNHCDDNLLYTTSYTCIYIVIIFFFSNSILFVEIEPDNCIKNYTHLFANLWFDTPIEIINGVYSVFKIKIGANYMKRWKYNEMQEIKVGKTTYRGIKVTIKEKKRKLNFLDT